MRNRAMRQARMSLLPYSTFPPLAVQSTTELVSPQPLPLQAFWPLQAEEAVLQALWPLHWLRPLHFTPWACVAVAKVPAAKSAAAVATMVRLVILSSLLRLHGDECRCGSASLPALYAAMQPPITSAA